MRAKRVKLALFWTTCIAGLLALAFITDGQARAEAQSVDKGRTMQLVTSQDGTRIAYDKVGNGPAVIVANGALATRSSGSELAQLLANDFTVYSYDRRGRGESGDTKQYSVKREIEDIEALINAAGGSAYLYGKSSGACLALEAASSLGDKIGRLAIYEAPYSDAEGAAEEWREFTSEVERLLAANRRADAVTRFMRFVGAPDEAIAGMKASPEWPSMEAMAPTLAYDNAVVGDDRAVPVDTIARVKALTLVMDGGASLPTMPFMRLTADKIAQGIPNVQRRTIEGQAHDVDSKVLAPILVKFFS